VDEKARREVQIHRKSFEDIDIEGLKRLIDPLVNPTKNFIPAQKYAAEELIEQKQLALISRDLESAIFETTNNADTAKAWARCIKRLSDAQLSHLITDVEFVEEHKWSKHEAEIEVRRRSNQREDLRYRITTYIAVAALAVALISLLN